MRRGKQAVRALPLRAMYALGELARAASMDPRTLRHMLAEGGVEFYGHGRITFVRITDLHEKAFPLWEAIQTVQTLLRDRDRIEEPISALHPRHRAQP
jgi:hypothetical protein